MDRCFFGIENKFEVLGRKSGPGWASIEHGAEDFTAFGPSIADVAASRAQVLAWGEALEPDGGAKAT